MYARIPLLLLAAVLALVAAPRASAQQIWWRWQHPTPVGGTLSDVALLPSGAAVAVGQSGAIIRSTDAGASWAQVPQTDASTIVTLAFRDELTGLAADDNGWIHGTTDGGKSWRIIGGDGATIVYALTFVTGNVVVAVGVSSGTGQGATLRSSDGGRTWLIEGAPVGGPLFGVTAVDESHLWAVGSGRIILASRDGGLTWRPQLDPSDMNALYSVDFVDTLVGVAAGGNGIALRTTNGGDTWTRLPLDGGGFPFHSVSFGDARNGIIIGNGNGNGNGFGYRSTDGGATWSAMTVPPGIARGRLGDNGAGLMVGISGAVYRTTNGGETWLSSSRFITWEFFTDVAFADSAHGLAVGDRGVMMRTSDAGASWIRDTVDKSVGMFTSIAFGDPLHAVASTRENRLFATTDGGITWSFWKPAKPVGRTRAVEMKGASHAWAVGDDGLMRATTDGGATWHDQTGTTRTLSHVDFYDETQGFALGADILLSTTDGGQAWTSHELPLSHQGVAALAISTVGSGECYIALSNGDLAHTTNAGTTWKMTPLPRCESAITIQFIDRNEGWAAFANASIYHTTDGGAMWRYEPGMMIPTEGEGGASIFFTDSRNGTLVGKDGAILRYVPDQEHAMSRPVPLAPRCGIEHVYGGLEFRWASVPGATGYRLQVSTSENFGMSRLPFAVDRSDLSDTMVYQQVPLIPGTVYFWRVAALLGDAMSGWSEPCTFTAGEGDGVPREMPERPLSFSLSEPRPNPASGSATMLLHLERAGRIRLSLHDMAGRELRVLGEETMEAGDRVVTVETGALSNGAYLLRAAGAVGSVERVILVRR